MANELADAIKASAERLGISPHDLATAISYETAGSFDPWKKGPTTQWGEHRGLLQWGEPQRQKYGVTQDMSVTDQMKAAERYLTDAGVKPGTDLLNIYSAINSGRVGRPNASDENNGGAPGTVADKVATMAPHRMRATALLGGEAPMPAGARPTAVAAAPDASAPFSLAGADLAGAPAGGPDVLAAMAAIPQMVAQDPKLETPAIQFNFPVPPGIARARAAVAAMNKRAIA